MGLWVGLVCGSKVFTLRWVGLGWVSRLVGWVELGWRNWTHGQLWVSPTSTLFLSHTLPSAFVDLPRAVCFASMIIKRPLVLSFYRTTPCKDTAMVILSGGSRLTCFRNDPLCVECSAGSSRIEAPADCGTLQGPPFFPTPSPPLPSLRFSPQNNLCKSSFLPQCLLTYD